VVAVYPAWFYQFRIFNVFGTMEQTAFWKATVSSSSGLCCPTHTRNRAILCNLPADPAVYSDNFQVITYTCTSHCVQHIQYSEEAESRFHKSLSVA